MSPSRLETQNPRKYKAIRWLVNKFLSLLDFIISFLEMHLLKIVHFTIMAHCCSMVNALHMVVVITVLLSIMLGTLAMKYSLSIIGPFLGMLFITKMAYQTNLVPKIEPLEPCFGNLSMDVLVQDIIENTIIDPEWWGLTLIPNGDTVVVFYKSYILVFLVMTMTSVIRIRQKIARIDAGEPVETPQVMFPRTNRKNADDNLQNLLKYLINYGFYKLGVEITLSFCVFVIAFRMDVFSVLYSIWIALLFKPKRKTLIVLWPFFFTTVIFTVLWQYAMAVGISRKTCYAKGATVPTGTRLGTTASHNFFSKKHPKQMRLALENEVFYIPDYPWAGNISLIMWMFLPSYDNPPDTKKTLVDFVLLLLIQRQQKVFELEKKFGEKYFGGSNKEEYRLFDKPDLINPVPDHTGSIKTWIDVFKFMFMSCLFRVTLAFEFWNGASNTNVLSLGYLVGAFVFLWVDYNLCLWKIQKILKWWNILLGYTVFVIVSKAMLEFSGCIYGVFLLENVSWLVELLYLRCSSSRDPERSLDLRDASSFYWDVLCFTLAIFQRRYFQSFYFLHEKDDVLGVFRLQDKGAKLMDELQENKLKEFQIRERKTLMKIKKNMNRIKAWQKRMHGLNYNEPTDHATATRMGDYLMFEDLDEVSSKVKDSSSDSDEDYGEGTGGKPDKRKAKKTLTMSKFIGTVFKRTGDDPLNKFHPKKISPTPRELQERKEKLDKSKLRSKVEFEPTFTPVTSKSGKDKKSVSEKSAGENESEFGSEREKLKSAWKLLRTFLDSAMLSLISFFKKYSKDYHYIESAMKAERKMQKKSKRDSSREQIANNSRKTSLTESQSIAPGYVNRDSMDSRNEDFEDSGRITSQVLLVALINSICVFVMSKTELFCYLVIFLHTVFSPTLISIPLPLLVFMWGSLTTIRPTTTFWTVLIAYTEVTVVIKALFQNSIFPWNSLEKKETIRPEYPPLFLGIHRDNQFVIADLILLLLLFLHRYKLKSLGLWNRTHQEETHLPQNLKVYQELPSEKEFKKGNRSVVYQRKRLLNDIYSDESLTHYMQMATWKCTSRTTGKLVYWGNKTRSKILVKEIEGPILVTHEGRRLEPTYLHASQLTEDLLEGNVVLRVYSNDVTADSKNLFYRMSWVQHFTSLRKFFVQILVRDWRVSADFYTLMFVFEFIDFLIVFFAYSSFTEPIEVALEGFNFAGNQVPILYLFTIICHFLVIVIDRILYLRKSVVGKLILQFILIVMVHAWMFIILPIATESPFNQLVVPQFYYIISCLYFLMSAYQLRVGYPMRVQGHFLCKKFGYFNYYFYKLLQFIPFFNQLRTVLDYICTHSSLTMVEWLKMESIYQLVYENKCSRRADIVYPMPRGEECPKCTKYPPGIAVLLGIIVVIWLPFIIFALFSTVAQPNLPQQSSLELQIENFGNVYANEASFTDIIGVTESQFKTFQTIFKDNKKVWSFLSSYDNTDVAVLKFKFEPNMPWVVTPHQWNVMNDTISDIENPVSLYMRWQVQRIPQSQIIGNAKGFLKITLNEKMEARHQLADVFLNKTDKIELYHILPKFLHVTNEGEAIPVSGFLSAQNHTNPYRNATLTLKSLEGLEWWTFEEMADDAEELTKITYIPHQKSSEITIYTFNEKIIPKLLLNVSKRGIIGLYLSIVFFFWSIIKRMMWKYPYIMFDDMPNPDPVLKLCHDIYLARESHEFALEEDLYAKLLFLFRSPETMIKVTKLNHAH